MKKLSFLFVVFALTSLAFTNPASEMVNMSVDTDASFIKWTASKVTGTHYGKVKLKEGSLEFTDGRLTGGSFVADMTSITVEDLTGGSKEKLTGHLKSDDFFSVENHPTAEFVITNVISRGKPGDYRVTGEITIKGYTEEVKFNTVLTESEDNWSGKADIALDRTDFDIRFRSGTFFQNLGDKTIYDEFNLEVNLVAIK